MVEVRERTNRTIIMIDDKREQKRFDIFLIVEFKSLKKTAENSIGITRNLSEEGFSIESQSFNFECGEILEFKLKHPQIDLAATVLGEVIWKKQAWYKYLTGVKLQKVNEETHGKILALMSAVKDGTGESTLSIETPEDIPEAEKEEKPAATSSYGKTDELIMGVSEITTDAVLKETDHCQLPITENSLDARGEINVSSNEIDEEKVHTGKFKDDTHDRDRENILSQNGIYANNDNTAINLDERKKKVLFSLPVVTIVAVILAVALPLVIKNINKTSKNMRPAFTDSKAPNEFDKEQTRFTTNTFQRGDAVSNDSPESSQVQQIKGQGGIFSKQEEALNSEQLSDEKASAVNILTVSPVSTELNAKKTPQTMPHGETENILNETPSANNEKIALTDLLAKIDKTLKAIPEMEQEKPLEIKTAAVTTTSSKKEAVTQTKKSSSTKEKVKKKNPPKTVKVKKINKTPDIETTKKNDKTQKTAPSAVKVEHQKAATPVKSAQKPKTVKVTKSEKSGTVNETKKTTKAETTAKSEKSPKTEMKATSGQGKKTDPPVKNEKARDTKLIAKIEESEKTEPIVKKEKTEKTDPVIKSKNMPKIALLVTRKKSRGNQNIPGTNKGNVTNTDLFEKWKNIGSTKKGIPLFIDADNISYPSKDVVKLTMGASINKKEFIDLLEINCSSTKLRILEERNGSNPVLSDYSNEWRDIVPESMIIYNSVCPANK
jgi:hypothetical protein